jgi:hypothetical protein
VTPVTLPASQITSAEQLSKTVAWTRQQGIKRPWTKNSRAGSWYALMWIKARAVGELKQAHLVLNQYCQKGQ